MWHGGGVLQAEMSPDGKRIVTSGLESAVFLWDGQSGKPIGKPISDSKGSGLVRFSPRGDTFINCISGARLRSALTGRQIGRTMQHEGEIRCAVYRADGSCVLTGASDKTARLWDAATAEPLGPPLHCGGEVTAVAFNPEGDAVTCSSDGIATVWQADWLRARDSDEELQLRSKVATRRRLDASGAVCAISVGEWRRLSARLAAIGRSP